MDVSSKETPNPFSVQREGDANARLGLQHELGQEWSRSDRIICLGGSDRLMNSQHACHFLNAT